VDALGAFKSTFNKTAFAAGEWAEVMDAEWPAFEERTPLQLVPDELQDAYRAAASACMVGGGGD